MFCSQANAHERHEQLRQDPARGVETRRPGRVLRRARYDSLLSISVSAIRLTAFVFFLFITALLSTNDRAATATVEKGGAFILALAKEDFDTHMGSLAKELSRTAKDEYGVAVVGGDRYVYYFNPRMGTFNPRMDTGN